MTNYGLREVDRLLTGRQQVAVAAALAARIDDLLRRGYGRGDQDVLLCAQAGAAMGLDLPTEWLTAAELASMAGREEWTPPDD